ncbi:protein of unknown function DUF4266 [Colwellia psychrerythraea]|uniref:DUF4266 domain-containing protein n=2 Tax=Colwellia psychrerythraea TaxID=28229 RepID=A0A099KSE8_COLPS|nr:protein of unknown function DUF4266 [Colwellia psychrerythraea]
MKTRHFPLNKLFLKKTVQFHQPKFKLTLLAVVMTSLSGCSSLGVEPWERDLLAKKAMALTSSPIDSALDDHIYFSKEASSGGKSFGGGGCGCN